MQVYILGIIIGAVYGSIAGALKYFLLWRKLLKGKNEKNAVGMKGVTSRMMIGYAVNTAVIVSTLIFLKIEAVDFTAAAISTAVALSFVGRFFSIQKVMQKTNIEE